MPNGASDPPIEEPSPGVGRASPLALIERERQVLGEIAAGVPLRQVLDDLLRAVEAESGNRMMTSVLFQSEDGRHMLHGAAPSLPAAYNKIVDGLPMGVGVGSCGTAAALGQPVYVTDIATDPLWQDFRDLALGHGLRACWSMPIKGADGTVLGTFAVYYGEPRAPTSSDIEAISFIARTAALAIERHRSDLELRRSQSELRALNADLERQVTERAHERSRTWQLSPDLLGVLNPDGFFEKSNPAWQAVLGWSEEDLRTTRFLEFLHPDDLPKTEAAFEGLKNGIPVLQFENRYRAKSGGYRFLSWTAVPEADKFYCSARDVTRDHEREAILKDTQDFARLALSAVRGVGVWTYEVASDLFFYDPFIAELYGIDPTLGPRGIPRSDFLKNVLPEDQAALRATMNGGLVNSGDLELEYRLRHPDGSIRWVLSRGHTYHDESGLAVRRTGVGVETTSQRQTEEALRQSQKMEAVGQLTGGVAHDFNNLLTIIRASTDLLKRPNLTEERRDRYIAAISDTVDRAAKLTGQLLAFARRQALKPEVFAVGDSVQAIVEMLGTLTGPQVEIVTRLPEEACWINADLSQFDTALVNMAVNARDAMKGEGRLTITVAPAAAMPAVRSHAAIVGSFVAVSIADTGSGIPPERLDLIFEPFFTTKPVGQGTGLGLSQVFGFAKQSGGEVAVASEMGQGTVFTLYLPRVAEAAQAAPETDLVEPLPADHATCVLVVEDNSDVGSFAAQALAELGYVTTLAANAEDAAIKLAQDPGRFDVVFTDVVMPGMSGIEFAQQIRRSQGDLPVVLTSGYSHVLAQSGSHGFDLLHKPYSVDELSEILRKVVLRRRRAKLPPRDSSGG